MTPHGEPESNPWSEYRRLVTKGMEDLDLDIKNLDKKVERQLRELNDKLVEMQLQFTKEITQLQTKASLWGGLVGAVTGAIVAIVTALIARK